MHLLQKEEMQKIVSNKTTQPTYIDYNNMQHIIMTRKKKHIVKKQMLQKQMVNKLRENFSAFFDPL